MEGRDILIYLSIKRNGDWDKIYEDIKRKKQVSKEEVEEVVALVKSKSITILDDEYPSYLKQIYKPPFVLYYYGDISLISNLEKNISVVGSRNCSSYGEKQTIRLTKEISSYFNIVSGLAKGVDFHAHKTCIENNGKTIAVLGSGIDNCYPIENIDLYNIIKSNHLLISEYPSCVAPDKSQFPMRNRLIAALSRCLLVTEAYYKSGTSITVSHALAFGHEICCVPYPVGEKSACNLLIKDGARLTESGQDIYDEINFKPYHVC